MRLFRGKGNDWYYGDLVHIKEGSKIKYYILWESSEGRFKALVKEGTIGQSIGMFDKNKELIFEGDIVRVKSISLSGKEEISEIVADRINNWVVTGKIELAAEVEVIGNVIDNPELIEKGEKNE